MCKSSASHRQVTGKSSSYVISSRGAELKQRCGAHNKGANRRGASDSVEVHGIGANDDGGASGRLQWRYKRKDNDDKYDGTNQQCTR